MRNIKSIKTVKTKNQIYLFDSLRKESTVRFVREVLLIGFSHQQGYFSVEERWQSQNPFLQNKEIKLSQQSDFQVRQD